MIRVAGGAFELGSERGYPDERPARATRVPPFWIDRTEVTHAQFAAFVAATGYVTEAERNGGSAVFVPPAAGELADPAKWWRLAPQASWRHPDGDGSAPQPHEAVVGVTYADAMAYARWLGRELPSEAQWEFAAKAGRDNEAADRALRDAQGRPLANFWQGVFPAHNSLEDGFALRAPVGCFPPNPYGAYDLVGNVWEWTRDPYGTGDEAPRRVIKGGSYLCSTDYCVRARAASRQPQDADLGASHLGFRTVVAD